MNIMINTSNKTLNVDGLTMELYSKDAFELLSDIWLKVAWNEKYSYYFSWMGRPIIQLPQDMIRIQEVVYRVKPDVIIETGVAHGGSLVFYASLCKAMGVGRVIGVDVQIRESNRKELAKHELSSMISLVEGNSTAPEIVGAVKSLVKPKERVMVILDSDHSKKHVLAELWAYHDLVTAGSYIVATDGIMESLWDVPRGNPTWQYDNPHTAVAHFLREHSEFVSDPPTPIFKENELTEDVTHWRGAWLKRVR